MSYTLVIHKQVKKKLQSLARPTRDRIVEKLVTLSDNPDNPGLDIKRLEGAPYYRLRVGDWRIIYARQNELKILGIELIKPRGDAYQ